ncbi:uncharacterized protein LAESUDRAFT_746725 [Laetiporus sulphureus 93-53]|uniref:Uncharacterized protein n=1 Tax=Laetiporus sulphureus 93-53 TaxID=1314785 RepID=A0A165HMP9_9APHY|nr:uncharacterized protein LAESUDRAFT_746725 [Laetiporus sulphureus 93-53]KZT11937.1 hypothetical protein LAESUDRAFT_746725 [Laetiporus sulphureus 93-53]
MTQVSASTEGARMDYHEASILQLCGQLLLRVTVTRPFFLQFPVVVSRYQRYFPRLPISTIAIVRRDIHRSHACRAPYIKTWSEDDAGCPYWEAACGPSDKTEAVLRVQARKDQSATCDDAAHSIATGDIQRLSLWKNIPLETYAGSSSLIRQAKVPPRRHAYRSPQRLRPLDGTSLLCLRQVRASRQEDSGKVLTWTLRRRWSASGALPRLKHVDKKVRRTIYTSHGSSSQGLNRTSWRDRLLPFVVDEYVGYVTQIARKGSRRSFQDDPLYLGRSIASQHAYAPRYKRCHAASCVAAWRKGGHVNTGGEGHKSPRLRDSPSRRQICCFSLTSGNRQPDRHRTSRTQHIASRRQERSRQQQREWEPEQVQTNERVRASRTVLSHWFTGVFGCLQHGFRKRWENRLQ